MIKYKIQIENVKEFLKKNPVFFYFYKIQSESRIFHPLI